MSLNKLAELLDRSTSSELLRQLAAPGWPRFVLCLFLALGTVRYTSRLLSRAVLNNFSPDDYDWRKELVLVTGGSGGFGDMLVRKLAKHSIKVVSIDVHPPKSPLPSNAYFYQADIRTTKSIQEVAQQIRQDHGDPTVLVNNAGVGKAEPIIEETEEDLRHVFDVNIIAQFLMIKEFLPSMIKNNHGHIVTVASMASFVTGVRNADYCATKAGVLALHEGLAQELRHKYKAPKVRTSIIHPVYTRTPMIQQLIDLRPFKTTLLEAEPVVDRIFKQILSGRSGNVLLPRSYTFLAGIRGWPFWLQEALRNLQKDVLTH